MADQSPNKKRKAEPAGAGPSSCSDGDAKMSDDGVPYDGEAKLSGGGGASMARSLPDMIVVQMLSTEGDVPGVYGVPVKEFTKEMHLFLRDNIYPIKEEEADKKALKAALKANLSAGAVDALKANMEARKKADQAADETFDSARVELHSDFNSAEVVMLNGTTLYRPDRKPVGKFVGVIIYRDRN
jgi:hypothetical protein